MMGHEAVVNLAACQRDAKVVEVVGAAMLADTLDALVGGVVRAGADAVFQAKFVENGVSFGVTIRVATLPKA